MLNYPQKKRRPKSGRPFPYLMPPRLKTLPIKKQIPPPYILRGMGSVTPASTLITQRRSRKICDAGVRKDFAEPKKAVLKTPRIMRTKTFSIQPRTPRQTSLTALPN
ncbi:hypothetical protein ATPR_1499 [Acetobacter tropicalis NBRC 101654]|uniref:Uncharacterized protein n=1 Tax=Acetobacter tropicalis NBRC 101654 TaxID=749388 RepID=F7VDQ0_9PROT|nr:hypothetical protein ATPR_1499 [Acetobacter tropicalis NBRC 101654]